MNSNLQNSKDRQTSHTLIGQNLNQETVTVCDNAVLDFDKRLSEITLQENDLKNIQKEDSAVP